MLRSHTLMLDNTLIPAYQERVASHTFNTDEHTNEQFDDDDDDNDDEEHCEELLMTGTGRRAGKHERIKRNMGKSKHPTYFESSVFTVSKCISNYKIFQCIHI